MYSLLSQNKEEFDSPLREFDNVILTPHVGGSTQEAQENIDYAVDINSEDAGTALLKLKEIEETIRARLLN